MVPILVGSLSRYSGKSVVCVGLALRFRKDNFRTGYFRPIGLFPTHVDDVLSCEDAVFFKKALELDDALSDICPVVMTDGLLQRSMRGEARGVMKEVLTGFEVVSQDKDIVVVGALGNLHHGRVLGCATIDLAHEIGAKVIMVDRCDMDNETADGFLHVKDQLGDMLIGGVINRLRPDAMDEFQETVRPYLEREGIPILAVLPEDPVLGATTVGQLLTVLDGDLLCGEDKLDELVEAVSVGAMSADAALRYFRRVRNKAVITGGDRSDIQLAALETSTKCLILTGDQYPSERIVARAEESGVPVMVVKLDTMTTVDQFDSAVGQLTVRNMKKVERAAAMLESAVDFDRVYGAVGLRH